MGGLKILLRLLMRRSRCIQTKVVIRIMVIREERKDKGDRVSRWNACCNITGISVLY